MHVDNEGHLIPIGKVRGRRQSLDALVTKMGTKIEGCDNPYVFVSHGDCIDDAKYVAAQVKAKYGIKTEIIGTIGAGNRLALRSRHSRAVFCRQGSRRKEDVAVYAAFRRFWARTSAPEFGLHGQEFRGKV